MKLMIASDIHGSAYYCEKMIKDFYAQKCDKLFLLGDILYHGPRNDLPKDYQPKKVIAMLNEIKEKIFCIRGNCDTEVDQMVLEFPILSEFCILNLDNNLIYAFHGHNTSSQNIGALDNNDIVLCGHTHIPLCEKRDNYTYINPGSVSIPKENSHHSYIIYENSKFCWVNMANNSIYKEYNLNN